MGCQRTNNEDNYYLDGLYKPLELADMPMVLTRTAQGSLIAAVCDGMGGESWGEFAAWKAVSTIFEWAGQILSAEDQAGVVRACIRYMNKEICDEAKGRGRRTGSTLALAVVRGQILDVYNVGDSRVYLYSSNKLTQLSQDHTVAQDLIRMGLPAPQDGKEHHQLTQHLGIAEDELLLDAYHVTVPFCPGDRLLLCSDGLTDAIGEDDLIWSLANQGEPDTQALQMTKQVERAGGKDNVTALVISCDTLQ